jgi:hypothetical protein
MLIKSYNHYNKNNEFRRKPEGKFSDLNLSGKKRKIKNYQKHLPN